MDGQLTLVNDTAPSRIRKDSHNDKDFHVSIMLYHARIWSFLGTILTSGCSTGASGYIGGQVLYELAKTHPSSSIKALARSEATGKAILDAFPNVEIINGSLDDGPILAKAAAEADIVLRTSFAML